MAEALLENEDMFECAVCLTNMVDRHPRALVCLHTFCQTCLEKIKKWDSGNYIVECPTCRRVTLVPDGHIESLTENFQLKNMYDSLQSRSSDKFCTICKENSRDTEALFKCTKCHIYMCVSCNNIHEIRFCKKPHNIIKREDKSSKVTPKDQNICHLHNGSHIEYWCRNCRELLCAVCAIHEKHNKHDIDDIEDFVRDQLQTVINGKEKIVNSCMERASTLREIIDTAKNIKENVSDLKEKMKAAVDSEANSLIEKCNSEYIQPALQDDITINNILEDVYSLEENLKKCEKAKSFRDLMYDFLPAVQKQVSHLKTSFLPDLKTALPKFCEGTKVKELSIGVITSTQLLNKQPSDLEGTGTKSKLEDNSDQSFDSSHDSKAKFCKGTETQEQSNITEEELQTVKDKTSHSVQVAPLEEQNWFHGILPRTVLEPLLVDDGDFLVRQRNSSKQTAQIEYVLSVYWKGHKHFIIEEKEGTWRLDGPYFATVSEVILHQPCLGNYILNKPVPRQHWEIMNHDIDLKEKIGEGHTNEVFRGIYKPKGLNVAIFINRETMSQEKQNEFNAQCTFLRQSSHLNIVRFVGIVIDRTPTVTCMEFIAGGRLSVHLRHHGPLLKKEEQQHMCVDVACGMEYLEREGYIHRKLAARNCLIERKNIVKIAGLGMLKKGPVFLASEMQKHMLVRWTAPEALKNERYTSMSDVWSFGILMWEIFSLGEIPYQSWSDDKVKDEIDKGYRMPTPRGLPKDYHQIMLDCWKYKDADRPSFKTIHDKLLTLKRANTG